MTFCLIDTTNSFHYVVLPGLFIRVIQDEEAGKKVGGLQRGIWVKSDGCAMSSETRAEEGRGRGTEQKKNLAHL